MKLWIALDFLIHFPIKIMHKNGFLMKNKKYARISLFTTICWTCGSLTLETHLFLLHWSSRQLLIHLLALIPILLLNPLGSGMHSLISNAVEWTLLSRLFCLRRSSLTCLLNSEITFCISINASGHSDALVSILISMG